MSDAIEDCEDKPFCIRPAPNTCCPEMNDRTIKEFGYCDGCNTVYDLKLFKKKSLLALEQKEKVDRFVVEVFNRLKERAEFDRVRAETDLKILEKWRKDYLELIK